MSPESNETVTAHPMHRRRAVKPPTHVIALLLLIGACGGGGDAAPDAVELECPTTGRYMELASGASWTFRVDDGNGATEKTQTVGPLEDVGGAKAGTTAFRVTTVRPGGEVVSWQEDTGDAIRRHREQDNAGTTSSDEIYQPFKTRVDESPDHVVAAATWSESYTEFVTSAGVTTEAAKVERWEVEAVDEVISVPAGDFCTLRVKRTSTVDGAGGSVKRFWFARGVGKVREEGANQVEELTAFVPAN